jgi:hypothetical protein
VTENTVNHFQTCIFLGLPLPLPFFSLMIPPTPNISVIFYPFSKPTSKAATPGIAALAVLYNGFSLTFLMVEEIALLSLTHLNPFLILSQISLNPVPFWSAVLSFCKLSIKSSIYLLSFDIYKNIF